MYASSIRKETRWNCKLDEWGVRVGERGENVQAKDGSVAFNVVKDEGQGGLRFGPCPPCPPSCQSDVVSVTEMDGSQWMTLVNIRLE